MRNGTLVTVLVGLLALTSTGCKKQVPNDIVEKSLKNALRLHAPATTSAMCGLTVKGLVSANVTKITKKPDGKTGTAHVSGSPWMTAGAPSTCEGDVEFEYSYTQKTTGPSRRRTTTTTWFLDRVKLIAVQTKGVTFKAVDEKSTDDDDDDGK